MAKKYLLIFSLLLMFLFEVKPVQAQENASLRVVQTYISYLNANNWDKLPALWIQNQQQGLLAFLGNQENQANQTGLFNVKRAELVMWKRLPYAYAKNYLPARYMENFKCKEVWYVGVRYAVHREDSYQINGVNYYFVAVAAENGEWRIVLSPLVPVAALIRDGYGFGTRDEKTFDERRMRLMNR